VRALQKQLTALYALVFLFLAPLSLGSPLPAVELLDASSGSQCATTLRLLAQLATIAEQTHALLARNSADSPAGAEDGSDVMGSIKRFRDSILPHIAFVQFADSEALLTVTRLQLWELGLHSTEQSQAFLRDFPRLPTARQIAFVNSIVLRLLWEVANSNDASDNAARLSISEADLNQAGPFLRNLEQKDFANLSLFLLCHFCFRSQSISDRIVQISPEIRERYRAPFSDEALRWIPLHGFFTHPLAGRSTYDEKDWITFLSTLLTIQAHSAVQFFIATDAHALTMKTLTQIQRLPSLPDVSSNFIQELLNNGHHGPPASGAAARREELIRSTRSELSIVETQIQLHDWVSTLSGMGQAADLVDSLRTHLEPCLQAAETIACNRFASGFRFLLSCVGIDANDWGGYLIGNLLSRAILSFTGSPTSESMSVLSQIRSGALPIAAFARDLTTSVHRPADIAELRTTKAGLESRLERLTRTQIP
jgi:hypothetical protein